MEVSWPDIHWIGLYSKYVPWSFFLFLLFKYPQESQFVFLLIILKQEAIVKFHIIKVNRYVFDIFQITTSHFVGISTYFIFNSVYVIPPWNLNGPIDDWFDTITIAFNGIPGNEVELPVHGSRNRWINICII